MDSKKHSLHLLRCAIRVVELEPKRSRDRGGRSLRGDVPTLSARSGWNLCLLRLVLIATYTISLGFISQISTSTLAAQSERVHGTENGLG
jgi:hypothetical protein